MLFTPPRVLGILKIKILLFLPIQLKFLASTKNKISSKLWSCTVETKGQTEHFKLTQYFQVKKPPPRSVCMNFSKHSYSGDFLRPLQTQGYSPAPSVNTGISSHNSDAPFWLKKKKNEVGFFSAEKKRQTFSPMFPDRHILWSVYSNIMTEF